MTFQRRIKAEVSADGTSQAPLETLDLPLKNGSPLEIENEEGPSTLRGGAGKEERISEWWVLCGVRAQPKGAGPQWTE